MDPTLEQIGPLRLWISREHRFGTDAFLLAHFSAPHRGDRACDLCSGCGIIPVLWLRREAAPAAAYAVELLPQPIALLERTVRENALEGRLLPICRDLRELGPGDIPTTPPAPGPPPSPPTALPPATRLPATSRPSPPRRPGCSALGGASASAGVPSALPTPWRRSAPPAWSPSASALSKSWPARRPGSSC